jgi:hypothetical protein
MAAASDESGQQHSDRLATSSRAPGAGRATDGPAGIRLRWVRWRRRHLNVRTMVVVVVLSALLAPEAATIIDAAL